VRRCASRNIVTTATPSSTPGNTATVPGGLARPRYLLRRENSPPGMTMPMPGGEREKGKGSTPPHPCLVCRWGPLTPYIPGPSPLCPPHFHESHPPPRMAHPRGRWYPGAKKAPSGCGFGLLTQTSSCGLVARFFARKTNHVPITTPLPSRAHPPLRRRV